jgi:uncharacterized membrane protein YgcG
LAQPWLLSRDGGTLSVIQGKARYTRPSWLWKRDQVWEEPLSRFEGLRLNQVDIEYDNGNKEVTCSVELVHPELEKGIILDRDIHDVEHAESKLIKYCELLELGALSKIQTTEKRTRYSGGGGDGGGGGGNGGGGGGGGGNGGG